MARLACRSNAATFAPLARRKFLVTALSVPLAPAALLTLVRCCAGCAGPVRELRLQGKDTLGRGVFEGTTLDIGGHVRLKLAKEAAAEEEIAYATFGTYTCEVELPAGSAVSMVAAQALDIPLAEKALSPRWGFPSAATDVVTQVRFLRPDGGWSPWSPRNLLGGGDFNDTNRNGIPDWTWLFQLRAGSSAIFADWPVSDPERLLRGGWRESKRPAHGEFMDTSEAPPGAVRSLRLERHTDDGQDTAEMRRDLVPPGTALTVAGWNRYDLESGPGKGVMARFHEFDADGNRVNKFVLLGDDDFHEPTGSAAWRWRALSFTTMPTTTRLGIYPIRMIRALGRAWAANWEVREGTVYSEPGRRPTIFQEDFSRLDRWEMGHPNLTRTVLNQSVAGRTLVMKPPPLTVATCAQKEFIPVQEGRVYAFRIAMQNDASPYYDLTHETWVSCYLEFYDGRKHFIDYVKAMVFRPVLESSVGAAMAAPPAARWTRFRLVASHMTYGDPKRITGTMTASFAGLHLEESAFDPAWTPRPEATEIRFSEPIPATKLQIRSRLFTRDRSTGPSLGGYRIQYVRR